MTGALEAGALHAYGTIPARGVLAPALAPDQVRAEIDGPVGVGKPWLTGIAR
ncbi:MAG TPA: hypothetical protein VLW50_33005 [Streptosporangiaceae bacterium]|nr:hypothetical protein [Streptosporangiaceae bacterium]